MGKQRRTIAIIIPFMDQYYQIDFWRSIVEESRKIGYDTLFFCGGLLDASSNQHTQNNIIYKLINLDLVDGIICNAGTLANNTTQEAFKQFIEPYKSAPLINISMALDQGNNIYVDNYSSMQKIINHILSEHSYKNFAYLSGPKSNSEAQLRLDAFNDTMAAHHIPSECIALYEGDFSQESAIQGMEYLLDGRKFRPDIVICANDEMAIGVHYALEARGIPSPDTIGFTGFDDINNATCFVPAFTTLQQPFFQMGTKAVKGIDDLIHHRVDGINQALVGHLKIRESCGCHNLYIPDKRDTPTSQSDPSITLDDTKAILSLIQKEYLDSYIDSLNTNDYSKYQERILHFFDLIVKELNEQVPSGNVAKAYCEIIDLSLVSSASLATLDFIEWLRNTIKNITNQPLPIDLSELLNNALITANQYTLRHERKKNYQFMTMFYYSSELVIQLNQVNSISQMLEVLTPFLKHYHFDDFYIVLYDSTLTHIPDQPFVFPEKVEMKLGIQGGYLLPESVFESKYMLPPDILNSQQSVHMVFYPLFFEHHQFGYIVCDVNIPTSSIFRTVKDQVSNTLERVHVHAELKLYNKQVADLSIKDSLTGVLNRRGVYKHIDYLYQMKASNNDFVILVYGDIDGLKYINDNYGHHQGDYAISTIVSVIESLLSPYGKIGRLGGDEFIIIEKAPSLSAFKKSFTKNLKEQLDVINQSHKIPFTLDISLGFSTWYYKKKDSFEAALKKSDEALYAQKNFKKENR